MPSMNARSPVEALNPDEVLHVQRVIATHGLRNAAERLGLRTTAPLAKAAAGLAIHVLTASTIRAKLQAES
jgi:hypothetical protein